MKVEIPIEITLVSPPNGVLYALQKGKDVRLAHQRSDGTNLDFHLTLTLAGQLDSGAPRFTGPFAQGSADERFVYINIGASAGDHLSPWSRRAKIHISGITWEMVEQVQEKPGSSIHARFAGTDKKGEPTCASLRPIDGGWELIA